MKKNWVPFVLIAILEISFLSFKPFEPDNFENPPVLISQVTGSGRKEILGWYTTLGIIKTQTNDDFPANVIVSLVLGYKKDDKTVIAEITDKKIYIQNYIKQYFMEKSLEEINPQNEELILTELVAGINNILINCDTKIKTARFMQLEVGQK